MARTVLTPVESSRDGVAFGVGVVGDTANGFEVANDGRVLVQASNENGASHTLTFVIPGAVDGQAIPDRVETLPDGQQRIYGPFPVEKYGNPLLINVSHVDVWINTLHVIDG